VALVGVAETPAQGLAFLGVYGLGAMAAMTALAGAAGVPLARLARSRLGRTGLLRATGALSIVLGVVWAWPIVVRAAAAMPAG
jgi:hypothetical protein